MNYIDLFPTVISSTILKNINDSELLKYKTHLETQVSYDSDKLYGSWSNNQQLLNDIIFSKLKKTILDYSKLYLNELGHKFSDLQISNSWSNVLNPHQKIQRHRHPNSYISGVFYLNNATPIKFNNPLMDLFSFKPSTLPPKSYRDAYSAIIKTSKKQLLIFPSFLQHEVNTTKINNRISIAFNIIPKGEFGVDTSKLYL